MCPRLSHHQIMYPRPLELATPRIGYSHDIYDERRAYAAGVESDRDYQKEASRLCEDVRRCLRLGDASSRRFCYRLSRRRVHTSWHGNQVRWSTREGSARNREKPEQSGRRRNDPMSPERLLFGLGISSPWLISTDRYASGLIARTHSAMRFLPMLWSSMNCLLMRFNGSGVSEGLGLRSGFHG